MRKILFLFLPLCLFSVGIDPECIISQRDFPLIQGIIDPLKGTLNYKSVDYYAKGAEPLLFQKYYSTNGPNYH